MSLFGLCFPNAVIKSMYHQAWLSVFLIEYESLGFLQYNLMIVFSLFFFHVCEWVMRVHVCVFLGVDM